MVVHLNLNLARSVVVVVVGKRVVVVVPLEFHFEGDSVEVEE